MSDLIREDRDAVLRVGLVLAVHGGWTQVHALTLRLDGVHVAVPWLRRQRFIQSSEYGEVVRWLPQHTFDQLWRELVPERSCPPRLARLGAVAHRV